MNAESVRPTARRPARANLVLTLVAGIRANVAKAGQPPLINGEMLAQADEMIARYDEERGL